MEERQNGLCATKDRSSQRLETGEDTQASGNIRINEPSEADRTEKKMHKAKFISYASPKAEDTFQSIDYSKQP